MIETIHDFYDMHKKIMEKAAEALGEDAKRYVSKASHDKGIAKKHDKIEEKEAKSAAKDLKNRAKKAHEF